MKKEGKLLEDKKEDHKRMFRALGNPTRREMLKYIGKDNKKSLEEIRTKFDLTRYQAKMHLDFL